MFGQRRSGVYLYI